MNPKTPASKTSPPAESPLPTTLHILSLGITNNGIIEAMQINPDDGKPVVLNGDNGAGKTTVLNAIEAILSNANIAIRDGEQKATVKMELAQPGDTTPFLRIKRTVTMRDGKQGDALEILDHDGKQISSPRRFLDSMKGSGAALDPTEIMQARPGEKPETFAKRQADTLMERLGLKDQAKTLDDKIETLMATRKTLKSEVESAQNRVDAIEIPKGTPDTAVDVTKIAADMESLRGLLRAVKERTDDAAAFRQDEVDAQSKVTRLKKELAAAEKELKSASEAKGIAVKNMEAAINAADGADKKLAELQSQLQNAQSINTAVLNKGQRKNLMAEVTTKQQKVDSITKEIEDTRAKRLNIVKEAKIPVPGLELTDAGLIYKGVRLEDESQGNRARICALLAVSERSVRAKILLIREGSLINRDNKKIIYDIAMKEGWQVWEEHFCEDKPKEGLWIVEGDLKE